MTASTTTQATHFGPSLDFVGGMASVMAALERHKIGADCVDVMATYIPGSHPRSALATVRAIRRVARFGPRHVVHVHMSEGGSFIREAAVVAAARALRRPVVVSIHGPRFADFAAEHARLVASVLRLADAVTTLSDIDRDAVRRLVPATRVEILPNPTPIDAGSPPADATDEIVLFAGEIGPRKGADVLERAWRIVADARPQARCIMVGPCVLDHPPTGERLEVREPVTSDAIRSLLHAARVVALPSRGEALPMILTEAMAARRPFVSTPVGGTPSLAAGGILVPVGDHRALAAELIGLLENPAQAAQLGQHGQMFCRDTRSREVIDRRLRAIYLACMPT